MKIIIIFFGLILFPVIALVAVCLLMSFLAAVLGALLMPDTAREVLDAMEFRLEDQL